MKLLIFAQLAEARPTIERLEARPSSHEKTVIWSEGVVHSEYAFDGGWVVLSGMGIHAAQLAVSKYVSRVDEVWNLGLAGALSDALPEGSMQEIALVGKHLSLPPTIDTLSRECTEMSAPTFSVSTEGVRLISSDYPIHDKEIRSSLQNLWDLVDMEGYGIAYAAHHLGKRCLMWKIVSDFASEGGRALIRKNKEHYAELLAERVLCAQL